jgi:hypothetical protein
MAITIPNTFVDATIAQASEVNGNFTAVKNFVDALQAGTGFTAGAIPASALATDSVTAIKIVDGVVSAAKLASDSVTAIKILNGVVSYAKLDSTDVPNGLAITDQIVLGSQIFS